MFAAVLEPLLCAIGFLTRLPTPPRGYSEERVGQSAGFFSWVGLLFGGLYYALSLLPVSPRLAALSLVLASAWLSGGMHLDGLADSVDGLSGGRADPARTLAIMRDSRVGAHGVVALVLALLARFCLLEQLLAAGDARFVWAPVSARFLATLLLASLPYARESGLGRAFVGRVGARELLTGGLGFLPLFVLTPVPWLALGLSWLLPALWARRLAVRLGGLTGDLHGAAIELSELIVLAGLAALAGQPTL